MATDFAQKFGDAIRVNAVCPGFFVGDQNRSLLLNADGSPTDRGQQIINNTPWVVLVMRRKSVERSTTS